MADIVWNPYNLQLKTIKQIEVHFGVKFLKFVSRIEKEQKEGKGLDFESLSVDELMSLIYAMKVLQGGDVQPNDILEMSFGDLETLGKSFASVPVEAVTEDPHTGGSSPVSA